MNKESRKELQWWIQNFKLCNGWLIIQHQSFAIMKTDASKKGWGAFCQGIPTGGEWTSEEKENHINILELKTGKLALMSFHKTNRNESSSFSNRQYNSLDVLTKDGGYWGQRLLDLA